MSAEDEEDNDDDDDDDDYGRTLREPSVKKDGKPSKYLACFNEVQQAAKDFPYEIQFSFELPCRRNDMLPSQLIVCLVCYYSSASPFQFFFRFRDVTCG